MIEPTWKLLTLQTLDNISCVWRKWSDGREEICLVTANEYVKWLEEGNTPLPAEG